MIILLSARQYGLRGAVKRCFDYIASICKMLMQFAYFQTRSAEQVGAHGGVSPLSSVEFTANAMLPWSKTLQISPPEWQAMSDIERGIVQRGYLTLILRPLIIVCAFSENAFATKITIQTMHGI